MSWVQHSINVSEPYDRFRGPGRSRFFPDHGTAPPLDLLSVTPSGTGVEVSAEESPASRHQSPEAHNMGFKIDDQDAGSIPTGIARG